MANFGKGVQAFADRVPITVGEVVQKVGIGLLRSVVFKSPVGNPAEWKANKKRAAKGLPPLPEGYVGGRFRANWNVGLGAIDAGTTEKTDKGGNATVAVGTIKIDGLQPGQTLFLTNSLPYAIPLEYGNSTQAPNGMVRITVAEFRPIVAAAAARARRE